MPSKYKYIIATESYDPNIGGYVVLHKLCDEINKLGGTAYLVPAHRTYYITRKNIITPLLKLSKEFLRRICKFRTNEKWNTPILDVRKVSLSNDNWIVIYPESISGNPLNAKNVVRWLLHHPGFHDPNFFYGVDELYFRFHSGIKIPRSLLANTSDLILTIIDYPVDIYLAEETIESREGSAYLLRKGARRKIVHDMNNSIKVDGLSHAKMAKVFKSVKTFYSYDPYTAYSTFAVLSGCDSVVIPEDGVSIDAWIPDKTLRAGLAYGFEGIESARLDRMILIQRIKDEAANNSILAHKFMQECEMFFSA